METAVPMKVIRHKLAGTVEDNIGEISRILRKQLRAGIAAYEVRQLAEDIIRHVPARDRLGEIRAVHIWTVGHKRFTPDPYHIELFESPRRLVEKYHQTGNIMADCDSLAPLEASLLGTLGHRTAVLLIDANPFSNEYSHAIAQAWYQGNWLSLDPVADGKIGWTPKHSRERRIEAEL